MLLLQQLVQQAFGRLLVAPALDEDVENKAFLIDRAPNRMFPAGDGDDDLIQVPFAATARSSSADAVYECPAEFQALRPDRLMCHRAAASRPHPLDHVQAQQEPEIAPDRIADHLAGVARASIKWVSVRHHPMTDM